MSDSYVIDDQGVKHSRCHGVPARVWFAVVGEATNNLSKPSFRESWGIVKPAATAKCDDPDCKRLNRRDHVSPALYQLTRDLAPIKPPDDSPRQIEHCQGHPWKAGSCMCRPCAIVTTAKRMIDAKFRSG